MNNTDILEIFYNKIIPEAQKARIDCYYIMNIAFNVIINNTEISRCENLPNGVLIPTLKITDKNTFDSLLIEYVKKALEFYRPEDFSFIDDIDLNYGEELNMTKSECLTKYIICTLFANASIEDFTNPISFIESRLEMFDNPILRTEEEIDFGYIESIKARLYISEEISPIKSETPYRIKCYLQFDDGFKLTLPEIYIGNTNTKYKLYGIQKTSKNQNEIDERPYLKQIRKGLIAKINGAPEHYFLATMICLSLCSDKEIEFIPFLIERWNAKRIAIYNKAKIYKDFSIEEKEEEQEQLQGNITDIFLRYFKKLEDVSTGMIFQAVPYEIDGNLHISMNRDFESRSIAFNELFRLADEYKNNKNNLGR